MAPSTVLTPEDEAELQRLYAILPAATKMATKALTAASLEGIRLERFKDEVAEVWAIMKRIKEILGDTGSSVS
jgi:hypothetical protein